ncbi:hypothetical protein CIRG_08643 [Coccidioides immitis RMSCC 2394]|uniref:Uncharacterized protein n=1 Tax=Coccidioides immitis RMSCC 2394 TaxID=404692 RepID=A0A0J7BFK4_COCIT|nr:hypothetical protein CIRG_08643 [Coccidioides immitis RMSCC 2394]
MGRGGSYLIELVPDKQRECFSSEKPYCRVPDAVGISINVFLSGEATEYIPTSNPARHPGTDRDRLDPLSCHGGIITMPNLRNGREQTSCPAWMSEQKTRGALVGDNVPARPLAHHKGRTRILMGPP